MQTKKPSKGCSELGKNGKCLKTSSRKILKQGEVTLNLMYML